MRTIGFSTGALAYADFRKALEMLRGKPVRAVELSALRECELEPMLQSLDSLDLSQFEYISLHAPSAFSQEHEAEIVRLLLTVVNRGWPIILHPDVCYDYERGSNSAPSSASKIWIGASQLAGPSGTSTSLFQTPGSVFLF